jgi:ParB-like chromosome segregation protein Spo0J
MKVKYVKIKEVKGNDKNPRYIRDENFRKLVRSIEEFPQMMDIRPIVVNEDMVALGGNMRLKACKEAGLKEVPVIIVEGLSEKEQREFIIKDNVGYGEWDWEMLANEWDIDELAEWGLEADRWGKEDDEDQEKYLREKRIAIDIREEDYKEALGLIAFWKGRGQYVGGMVLDFLKKEKDNIGDKWI